MQNEDGVEIPASLCVTPDKPGRVIAVLPTLDHPDQLLLRAKRADLLIAHAAPAGESRGEVEKLRGLGLRAEQLGVKNMAITGMVGVAPESAWGYANEKVGSIAWQKVQEQQEGVGGRELSARERAAAEGFAVYPPSATAVAEVTAMQEVFMGRVFLPEDGMDLILEEHKGRDLPEPFDFEAIACEKRAPGMECDPKVVAEFTGMQNEGEGSGSDAEEEGRGSRRQGREGGRRGDNGGRGGGRSFGGRGNGRGAAGRSGGRGLGRGQGAQGSGRGRGGFSGRGGEQVQGGRERLALAR